MDTSTEQATGVYLDGDPCPIETSLSVDHVALALADALRMGLAFVRLPTDHGDALVRPSAIVAIVPEYDEDDE
jgi:hypothetical protein